MCLAACLVPACPPSSQELEARELAVVKASKYYKRETRAIQERYQELTKEKVRHRPSMQRAIVREGSVTNCYFMHIHSSTAASLMEDACAYTCFCLHALVSLPYFTILGNAGDTGAAGGRGVAQAAFVARHHQRRQ